MNFNFTKIKEHTFLHQRLFLKRKAKIQIDSKHKLI